MGGEMVEPDSRRLRLKLVVIAFAAQTANAECVRPDFREITFPRADLASRQQIDELNSNINDWIIFGNEYRSCVNQEFQQESDASARQRMLDELDSFSAETRAVVAQQQQVVATYLTLRRTNPAGDPNWVAARVPQIEQAPEVASKVQPVSLPAACTASSRYEGKLGELLGPRYRDMSPEWQSVAAIIHKRAASPAFIADAFLSSGVGIENLGADEQQVWRTISSEGLSVEEAVSQHLDLYYEFDSTEERHRFKDKILATLSPISELRDAIIEFECLDLTESNPSTGNWDNNAEYKALIRDGESPLVAVLHTGVSRFTRVEAWSVVEHVRFHLRVDRDMRIRRLGDSWWARRNPLLFNYIDSREELFSRIFSDQ